MDLEDLKAKLSENTAAVYLKILLLGLEDQGQEISDMAHNAGAISIVGVDLVPRSLAPPSHYGADIICGDLSLWNTHELW